jgi:uncharacterized protein YgfB (UPF0149 family)
MTMHSHPLPDFEQTMALAGLSLEAAELSECHGICCALLCRRSNANLDHFLRLLDTLEVVKSPGKNLRSLLASLFKASKAQFEDDELGIVLWLPCDKETLEDRTMALSSWCSGFLAGLGAGGGKRLEGLTDDANEALRDVRQISSADVTDTTESEEDENAFAEIVEYLRVVVLMIREDLRGPGQHDVIH